MTDMLDLDARQAAFKEIFDKGSRNGYHWSHYILVPPEPLRSHPAWEGASPSDKPERQDCTKQLETLTLPHEMLGLEL